MIDYSIKEVLERWVAILPPLMNIHGTHNRGSNSITVTILTCNSTHAHLQNMAKLSNTKLHDGEEFRTELNMFERKMETS